MAAQLREDAVNGAVQILRINSGAHRPWTGTDARLDAAGHVIAQARLIAHLRAQPAVESKPSQNQVAKIQRVIVGVGPADTDRTQDEVKLRFAGDECVAARHRLWLGRIRDVVLRRGAGRLPISQHVRNLVHRLRPNKIADDREHQRVGTKIARVKICERIPCDILDCLGATVREAMVGVRHRVAERTKFAIRDVLGFLIRLFQPIHQLAPQLGDLSVWKRGVHQDIRDDLQQVLEIRGQRFRAEPNHLHPHDKSERHGGAIHFRIQFLERASQHAARARNGRKIRQPRGGLRVI